MDIQHLTFLEVMTPKTPSGEIEYELYRGKHLGSQFVCIKKYKRKKNVRISKLIKEAKQLRCINHPNIVMFLGLVLEDDYIYQVSEYMQNGSVYDQMYVSKRISLKNMRNLFDMLDAVAKGMNYLHGNNMMHGNLNSTSILIDEDWNFKISDFGFKKLRERCLRLKRCKVGKHESPYWFAPEILRGERFGPSSDVYSYGILLWYTRYNPREIVNGQIPYQGMSLNEMIEEIGKNPKHKLPMTKQSPGKFFNSLIEKCLKREPTERPDFIQIVSNLKNLKNDWNRNHNNKV